MKTIALILQNAIRLLGLILIILGFMFWTRNYFSLIPLHTYLGITLVILLWAMAVVGIAAKLSPGLIAASFIWGLLVVSFGMTMGRMLLGRAHEVIRVVHFLIGLGAIGFAESLGARIKRRVAVRG